MPQSSPRGGSGGAETMHSAESLSREDAALQKRLVADVTWSERTRDDETLPADEPLQVGQYLSGSPWKRTFRRSDVPCPYCHEMLREAVDAAPARIVRILHRESARR